MKISKQEFEEWLGKQDDLHILSLEQWSLMVSVRPEWLQDFIRKVENASDDS